MIIFSFLCSKERFYLNIFKLKNPFHRKLLIFFTHTDTRTELFVARNVPLSARFLLAVLCFVARFATLKMIQQNKKLIESQTKKKALYYLLLLPFFEGIFFAVVSLEKHFLSVPRLSLFRIHPKCWEPHSNTKRIQNNIRRENLF